MTFILALCLVWGVFLSLFVLLPLLAASKQKILTNESENHFNLLLEKKEQLLHKCAFGICSQAKWNELTREEAMESLLDVSEELLSQGYSLTSHPVSLSSAASKNSEQGFGSTAFLSLLLCLFAASFLFFQSYTWAQTESSSHAGLPANIKIPQATKLPSGLIVPAVNQFVLNVAQGQIVVSYLGLFSNENTNTQAKILLPFPKEISNVVLNSKAPLLLEGSNAQEVIVQQTLTKGVNEIQGEFILNASGGSVQWKKNTLETLPGVTIFLMNLKPASFQAALPQDFFSIGGEGMEPQADPLKREFEKQLVRVGSEKSPYPEFSLKGIVPSRFYVYLMVAFFSCFFIMALAGSLWKLRAPKN